MDNVMEIMAPDLSLIIDLASTNLNYVAQVYNIKGKKYGAGGKGVTDDYLAIQSAIDDCSANGGGKVYGPPGTYAIGSPIIPRSNVHLEFDGIDVCTLIDHPNLGSNPIISAIGTPSNYIKNWGITGVTIRNGTAQTGVYTVGKDGIKMQYVDKFTMRDCKITEIQGIYGLVPKYCKNILIEHCEFYRMTYAGMYVLIENENITVRDSTFDTITSTSYSNTYLFGTGADTLNEGTFYLKNLLVENCVFKNNPRWEGIDTHGGENITFRKNYIENVRHGINAQVSDGYVSNGVLQNILIENNTMLQGSGTAGGNGINVVGTSNTQARDATIRSNKLTGFVGSAYPGGSITTYFADTVLIEDNKVYDYTQFAVLLYQTVFNAIIRDNKFINCVGANSGGATATAAIGSTSNGIFGVLVENNQILSDDSTKMPNYVIYTATAVGSWQIKNNGPVTVLNSALYGNFPYLPVEKSAIPTTNLRQKYGDIIYADTGRPGWVVSAPKMGYGSLDTTTIIGTANMVVGSKTLTLTAGSGNWNWLPPGMNITIAGAGASAAALNCRVLKSTPNGITVDTAASTTVTAGNVTMQGLTLTAY